MIGTKSKSKSRNNLPTSNGSVSSAETCVISNGTVFDGKFECSDNVRLDGTILGDVICDKRFVMGPSGRVEGSLTAEDCVVQGTVKGELKVQNSLHLQGSAKIEGDITAKTIRVDEGAVYNGVCKIG